MNAAEREQLRLSLMRYLDANATAYGLGEGLLLQMCRSEGRPELRAAEVRAELQYLEDKGLVARVGKAISPENRTYRLTAAGRDAHADLSHE
jgi:hypothetical protein